MIQSDVCSVAYTNESKPSKVKHEVSPENLHSCIANGLNIVPNLQTLSMNFE